MNFNKLSKVTALLMAASMTFSMIPANCVMADVPNAAATADANATEDTYVLMNIPYAEYYAADVNNDVAVDAMTSATLAKTRTASLTWGSYHVDPAGTDISGVTFPVKVDSSVDLSKYQQITDESTVTITTTNRGNTSTETFNGADALYESANYSYYVLSEEPSYYKEVSADADGNLVFSEMKGNTEATVLDGIEAELLITTGYGDYQLNLNGLEDVIANGTDRIYGVIVDTKEGSQYGMRHMENIWRVFELAWCTGFTDNIHGCPTSSAHYAAMMGQTIDKVTYYTDKGIYEMDMDLYVPVKFAGSVTVENAAAAAGQTNVDVTCLPADYDAEYTVEGLEGAAVANGVLTYSENAAAGSYTLNVTDKNGKYASLSASFTLTTEDIPVAYNNIKQALTGADVASYVKNISKVTVNGTAYSATGRGAVTVINADGTLDMTAAPFAEGDTFEVTVSATGYTNDLSFTATKVADTYVLMNIPYAEYYAADVNNDVAVDAMTSATLAKTRTASLTWGSYHVDPAGTDISGVTFPVKVDSSVDLSKYQQITDESTVTITTTNRGNTSTATFNGADALYESANYSYYVLSEEPSYYKEVSADANGNLVFSEMKGNTEATVLDGIEAELLTTTGYGDYQLNLNGLEDVIANGTDRIYGVIVDTKEGSQYGMRHMENIWRVFELAWCTGFTDNIHGCPTSSAHYVAMMGQTIDKVTYYTDKGIYEMDMDLYVPVKFAGSVTVENAAAAAGQTNVDVTCLPADYDAEYSVEGLEGAAVVNGVLTYSQNAAVGNYTLKVTDKNGKYAPMSASFTLTTDAIPVAYNNTAKALTGADVAAYVKNISKVTVNGTAYNASGWGAVTVIKEDGTLDMTAAPFAEGCTFEVTVSATGYTNDLSFTVVNHEVVADAAVAATATKKGLTAGSHCAKCGTVITAQKTVNAASKVTLSKTSYTYSGKVQKPSVSVKDSAGKKISTSYYTVKYSSSSSKLPGTYKVYVTFKGAYSGKLTLKYTIAMKATKVSSVKAGSKQLAVKWSKISTATGYQVQYSTKSSFKSAKTVTFTKNTIKSTTLKKLTGKKTYYVRVRTYLKKGTKKYYSSWSKAVKATTKK